MNYKNVLGIDPGAGGAWVYIEDIDGANLIRTSFFPSETPLSILSMFSELDIKQTYCVLEHVWGRPTDGGSRAFNFGRNYGLIEMSLHSLNAFVDYVTPQSWLRYMALGNVDGRTKTEWKNSLKNEAKELFPKQKITLKNADAFLIAEFAKRKLLNK